MDEIPSGNLLHGYGKIHYIFPTEKNYYFYGDVP